MEANRWSEATSRETGLKRIDLDSHTEPISDIDRDKLDMVLRDNFSAGGYVVAWLDYKVLVGTWENGAFHFYRDETFEHKFIQRLRIFNQQKEVHIWRSNGTLKGRLRTDELSGEGVTAVVAHQVLFGTTGRPLNAHFTEISEVLRGTKLILPFLNIEVNAKQDRVCIKTHNYVKFNPVHQATYCDCRFVAFTDGQRNALS
jgi:CRISPR-associated protein (TIGR03984 family)